MQGVGEERDTGEELGDVGKRREGRNDRARGQKENGTQE